MSDANVIVENSVSFNDYLKMDFGSHSKLVSCYHKSDTKAQRAMAVSCALELIRAELSGPGGYDLVSHMKALSAYADTIQDALKVNDK